MTSFAEVQKSHTRPVVLSSPALSAAAILFSAIPLVVVVVFSSGFRVLDAVAFVVLNSQASTRIFALSASSILFPTLSTFFSPSSSLVLLLTTTASAAGVLLCYVGID